MELLVNKVVSSMVQIIIFALVPFVWWIITARKKCGFANWIGLKKVEGGKKTAFAIAVVSCVFVLIGAFTLYVLKDVEMATSEFKGLGIGAVPAIIVYAIFNTALPEEILFRGFLLKRISNKFGFVTANTIQAFIFGVMHGFMFDSYVGMVKTILITGFTMVVAWFMGYINEKKANESIIPSWIVHSIANIFSGICAAFSIF